MRRKHIRIKLVDAFAAPPFNGSPAGVVTEADNLADEEMQLIARKMNAPVTAFVLIPETPEADYRLRFFTPLKEVDLSGHAAIATFHALVEEGRIWDRKAKLFFIQETNAGILPVELLFENGRLQNIIITQASPIIQEVEKDTVELAEVLGIKPREITETGLPVELAYTGMWHLIVPIRHLETFTLLKPDYCRLDNFNFQFKASSIHLFCLETIEKESTVHTRSFATAAGIREKPVSGTANGALGFYLVKNGVVEVPTGKVILVAEQEFETGRPGKVSIQITVLKEKVTAVQVGGTAVTLLDGILRL